MEGLAREAIRRNANVLFLDLPGQRTDHLQVEARDFAKTEATVNLSNLLVGKPVVGVEGLEPPTLSL